MKVVLFVSFIITSFISAAQIPPGYYDNAAGLTGVQLHQALHDIIDGHTVLPYSAIWTAFPSTDQHPTGRVWDMYSDNPGGSPSYIYQFGSDQCGQYNNEGDCYNREHSFPQSWFNDAMPMQTDLHHVYPTDGWVNGKRSNLPYGEVGSADWISSNGSKTGACSVQGYSNTVFEPIDEYKGDLARTYFYMLTRYKDEASSWSSNTDMLQGGIFTQWAEVMLLQWHTNDPVSSKETDRNNAVHDDQNNRNPFIDNPQWVESIWGPTASISEQAHSLGYSVWGTELVVHNRSLLGKTYSVCNINGKTLASGTIQKVRTEVPALSHGIYLMRVENSAIRFVR